MKVTILGSSGFIGRHLGAALRARGDTVVGVSLRNPTTAWRECDGVDAVVNLAGENIAQRWTHAVKEKIRSSRVDAPRQLIEMFGTLRVPPRAYVSASAVGYNGTSETQPFTDA
ncbi:MAG TPA: NAD-dependent epimerase/dehydratase family protein, partial [Candidatus Acidoferrales bacterium]|nr:NAD-dependent epimerase/dehydratase family protein [Candidatus Acidoferrales bacterium]